VLPAQARLAGQGELTWWGLRVYEARLWTGPGFEADDFARRPFALELTYLRAIKGRDIAARSIEEMRRAGEFTESQAQRWRAQLEALLPDVQPGDRIAGVHRPGKGAAFLVNGRSVGEIEDEAFARLFFAIWLGPATSDRALRAALLGTPR
jgi:hypothetical protein